MRKKVFAGVSGALVFFSLFSNLETRSFKDDSRRFELVRRLAEANHEEFHQVSNDSFSISQGHFTSMYSINEKNKLTSFNMTPTAKRVRSNVKGLTKNDINLNNTYYYSNEGVLVDALTNGQKYHLEQNIDLNSGIIQQDFEINDEPVLRYNQQNGVVSKTYLNGSTVVATNSGQKNRYISINNVDTYYLELDDYDNALNETNLITGFNKKYEYSDNGDISKYLYKNFTYTKDEINHNSSVTFNYNGKLFTATYDDFNAFEEYSFDAQRYLLKKNNGFLTETAFGNNTIIYDFDPVDDVTNFKLNGVLLNGYELISYNPTLDHGNISGVYNHLANTDEKYKYDDLGQLVRWWHDGYNTNYVYDIRGNLVSEINSEGEDFLYTYGSNDNLLSINGQPVISDNGYNITAFSGNNITYFREGLIKTFDNGEKRTEYLYDSMGKRDSKIVNGIKTDFYYVNDKLLLEDCEGRVVRYFYDKDNEPLGFQFENNAYWYIKDFQGIIQGIVDDGGTVLVSYIYDPWGKLLGVNDISSTHLSEVNNIIYKGYYYDFESQLYYLQTRYYSPELHRFLTRDSIEYMALYNNNDITFNLFSYTNNNPVMYSDPSGYVAITASAIVAGFIALYPYLVAAITFIALLGTAVLAKWIADMGYDTIVGPIPAQGGTGTVNPDEENELVTVSNTTESLMKRLVKTAKETMNEFLKSWWKMWENIYDDQVEKHHIIAQNASAHALIREVYLFEFQHRVPKYIHLPPNTVDLKKVMHRHLHSDEYYKIVRTILEPYPPYIYNGTMPIEQPSGKMYDKNRLIFLGLVEAIGAALIAFSACIYQ